jgi:sporulation protein YlmC with PRC-barrel domain
LTASGIAAAQEQSGDAQQEKEAETKPDKAHHVTWSRASASAIVNAEGEAIGRAQDLVIRRHSGAIVAAIVSLRADDEGSGKRVLLPMDRLQWQEEQARWAVTVDDDTLAGLEECDAKRLTALLDGKPATGDEGEQTEQTEDDELDADQAESRLVLASDLRGHSVKTTDAQDCTLAGTVIDLDTRRVPFLLVGTGKAEEAARAVPFEALKLSSSEVKRIDNIALTCTSAHLAQAPVLTGGQPTLLDLEGFRWRIYRHFGVTPVVTQATPLRGLGG